MKTVRRRLLFAVAVIIALSLIFVGALTFSAKESTASAEIVPTTETFETKGASVRLVGEKGLRFTTYVNAGYIDWLDANAEGYRFGTLIIPSAVLGNEELTVNTDKVLDVSTEKWGESILDGETVTYYTYHAVLWNIPSTQYATGIKARPYVYYGGEYHYDDDISERSVGEVAAIAVKSGDYEGEQLEDLMSYVDGATGGSVSFASGSYRAVPTIPGGVSLDAVAAYEKIYVGNTLTLSVNGNYSAIWTSSDENVATVNQNGVVTGVAQGVATITATLGSNSATYRVAVVPESTAITGGTLEPTVQERKYVNNSDTFVASGDFDIYVKASETSYSNGIYSVTNFKSGSGFRFYSDGFDGLNAKDKVSVTITYKYVNAKNSAAGSLSTPSNDIGYDSNKGYATYSLTANAGTWSTLTFDAYISKAAGDYVTLNGVKDQNRYASGNDSAEALAAFNAIYNGTNANNIQFAFALDKTAGSHLEIKSIDITPAYTQAVTTERVIDAGSVNIVSVLGISGVKGTLSYTVTDKNGIAVAVTNGAFTATAQNYYDVTATATNAAGNTYTNGTTVRLVVNGTYMVKSGAEYKDPIGDAPQFKTTGAWSQYRLYLDGLDEYEVGDTVYVSMTLSSVVDSTMTRRLFIIGRGDNSVDQNVGTYIPTGNSGWHTIVFPATVCSSDYDYSPLTSITGTNAKHIKITFVIENLTSHAHVATYWAIQNAEITPYFEMTNTEVAIDENTEIDIATVAGIDNVFGEMSYTVTDKDGSTVAVTNGKFTSGTAQNYYDITATATVGGNTTSKTARFIVKGTFIASSGYSAISYANNNLTATKLSNDSLTNFRLYLDGLEDYEVGDLVYVTMNYRADVQSTASQKFLVIGKNTGSNTYPAITINADSTITFVAAVCTADDDFTGMVSLTTLSGNRAKHIKVETWFYNAATEPTGHVTGSFTIKSAYVSKFGYAETVRSTATSSVNSEGNLVINNVGDSTVRFYFNDLANFNAGDTVAVTLKYKYNYTATEPNAQSRCFYGPVTTSKFDLLIARGTLICDGAEHTVTFNAAVSNTAGNPNYNTGNIVGGTNAKNLIIDTWLTAGTTFEITDVSIAAT